MREAIVSEFISLDEVVEARAGPLGSLRAGTRSNSKLDEPFSASALLGAATYQGRMIQSNLSDKRAFRGVDEFLCHRRVRVLRRDQVQPVDSDFGELLGD